MDNNIPVLSNDPVPMTGTHDIDVVDVGLVKKEQSKMDAVEVREEKIKRHYNGTSLTDRIKSDNLSVEDLLGSLLTEYVREVDNLAGNQILATSSGNIETSTVISSKRVEIIDRMFKAVMAKKEFDSMSSIDVDSPSMRIVFRYFMGKCKESFIKSGFSSEISDTFFRCLTEVMQNWKKELKKEIAEIKNQ